MKFEINILGVEYTVYIDERALENACEELDFDIETTHGLHLDGTREIFISERLEDWEQVQTLFHELLHAIGTITGHENLAVSKQKNELFVNAIANGITTALANPEVLYFVGTKLGVLTRCKDQEAKT